MTVQAQIAFGSYMTVSFTTAQDTESTDGLGTGLRGVWRSQIMVVQERAPETIYFLAALFLVCYCMHIFIK